jgi:hypothetical protein
MPIPKPKAGEKEVDFIDRCMGDPIMNKEYPKMPQRHAICRTSWKNNEPKKGK